jgi:hypothetical protein
MLTKDEVIEFQKITRLTPEEDDLVSTTLSLYAEQEAMEKRVEGLIKKWKDHKAFNQKHNTVNEGTIEDIVSDLEGLKEGGNAIK